MNGIISKVLFFTSASRAVSIIITRNIFTKEYLGLEFLTKKQNESCIEAGQNILKMKYNFMTSYKRKGIKNLRKYEILNYMGLVDCEKDMANLSIIMEDFLAHPGDLKDKPRMLCNCIQTCYLRRDLKHSRFFSEGDFFQYFEKLPLAQLTHFQILYDHGHYQELVDKFKKLNKVHNGANLLIVMAALCRLGTLEAYKQASEFFADEIFMPKEVKGGSRTKELFAWFSIQMGHYDIAIETLRKKKQPSNLNEKLKSIKASTKIRANVILFALVKSGKVDICLSEISNQLKNYSKFGFTPVYSSELIQEIAEAVKYDEKLSETYKELPNDLEEKGKVENATVEDLVFRPIDRSPHSVASDQAFTNPYYYQKDFRALGRKSKDYPNFKYL